MSRKRVVDYHSVFDGVHKNLKKKSSNIRLGWPKPVIYNVLSLEYLDEFLSLGT